jgi:protein-S-isoprenylcysteine O-methyltransferase Ste14
MKSFFSRPAGYIPGMKLIRACGFAFALLHLGFILLTPQITNRQGICAAILYIAALLLFWWALRTNSQRPLSAVFSPDTPIHLTQHGPYRFIRHPFYCSYLLTWAAGVAATAQIWLLPTVAVMLVIYIRAARMEERKFTESPLAGTYALYRSRTGLFVPNPFKLVARRPLSR